MRVYVDPELTGELAEVWGLQVCVGGASLPAAGGSESGCFRGCLRDGDVLCK